MTFAKEGVSAGTRDGAHNAAQRAAVFGVDPAGLDLHFLQEFERSVLARLSVDHAGSGHAVDVELVLRRAGAIDLISRLDGLERAEVDRGRKRCERLEAAGLGQVVELFGISFVALRTVVVSISGAASLTSTVWAVPPTCIVTLILIS